MNNTIKPSDLNVILAGAFDDVLKIRYLDQLIDPIAGMGAMGVNRDIDYFGFKKKMSVSTFELLVPNRPGGSESIDELYDLIIKGKKIAPPTLFVQWLKLYNAWLVTGHEGRGRIKAIRKLISDKRLLFINNRNISVHIIPIGMRSRDLTDNMLNAKFISQIQFNSYNDENDTFDSKPILYEINE